MSLRPHSGLLFLALAVLLIPATIDAQVRRGRATSDPAGPWAPVAVGVHFGYDDSSFTGGEILGAHAHVPVLRSGRAVLMPSAEMTFLRGAKEYQYSAELVYMTAGAEGGAFLGGGIGRRDSVIDGPRATYTTYSIVGGIAAGAGPMRITVQVRWLFLQDVTSDFKPRPITIGASFPLWGRS